MSPAWSSSSVGLLGSSFHGQHSRVSASLSCDSPRPHPRIVILYGVVTTDPNSFGFVIEFCVCGDLRNNVLDAKDMHLSIEHMLQILMDVAQVI